MSQGPARYSKSMTRLVLGAFLMSFVIWWVGVGKVWAAFSGIKVVWIIPILATAYLGIAISCMRWRILLSVRGISASLHRLIFYYVIGYFFSSFLPSMFGGDIVRSYVFGKEIKSQIESFASVFMERLTGLAGLVGVAFVASLLNYDTLREKGLAFFMYAIVLGFVLFVALIFTRPLVERIGRAVRWKKIAVWRDRFMKFHDAVYSFRTQRKAVVMALFYSVLFQLLTSVNTYIVCLALGIEVRFLDLMLVVPIILLICTIPLTPNSMGIWEGSFMIFFSRLGVSDAGALSIGLVLRAKNILVALLGGIFYSLSGTKIQVQEAGDGR